jgi:predicted  nucleic acid-binding Zn-ribbon protein
MKRDLILLPIVLLMIFLGAAPVVYADKYSDDKTSGKEVQHEVVDAAKAIKNFAADKRDEAAKNVEVALISLDSRIDAMEERIDKKWDKMNEAARERARSTLTKLRKKRIQVAEKYGSLKNSSSEAWEHMKKGFSDSYRVLRSAWEKAESEY